MSPDRSGRMDRASLTRAGSTMVREPIAEDILRPLWERIGDGFRSFRHPLRVVALAMSALALSYGIASELGLLAVIAGAALGVLSGELLARTPLRSVALIGALVLLTVLGLGVSKWMVYSTWTASSFGPAFAIRWSGGLRFFIVAFSIVTTLRMIALRVPALLGVELVASAAALATLFASHRDGVIARPLWLSDWAWQNGVDPEKVFLAIGAVSVSVLGLLLLAESSRRVSPATALLLPLLPLLALLILDLDLVPKPEASHDLGLTDSRVGEPPLPTQEGSSQGPGEGQGQGQQGGQKPEDGKGAGQGEGQDPQGGQGQGQDPQGGQGQGQDPQGGQGGQGQQQQGGGQGQQQQQGGSSNQPREPNLDDQSNQGKAAPMAVVLLGDDYDPPLQAFYFRQDSWSHYNGSRLVSAQRGDVDWDLVRSFPSSRTVVREPPPEPFRQEVNATVSLLVEHAKPFALESVVEMKPERNPNPKRFLRSYSFVSQALAKDYGELFGRAAGHPDWTDAQRAYYLAGPKDPRYAELAHELIGDLPDHVKDDPFAKAVAIKLWMDQNLIYSTAERHAGVADPTADFLFGNRIGYCVHFAHAAVYMWRSLGIPARVSTGYHVEEDARRGSAIIITGGNAHAWPELYLEGVGWVVLDIAAAQNLDPPGTPTDDDMSDLLSDMARQEPTDPGEEEQKEEPTTRRHFFRDLGLGLLASALLAAVALYLVKLWRFLIPTFCGVRAVPRLAYREILDRLAEVGLSREFGETRERFARRMAARMPAIVAMTDLHVAARMGSPDRPLDRRPELDRTRWRELVAAVRKDLSSHVPFYRRLLGWLDPTSIFRAR